MKIGFDAKRYFSNFTGLGNYSRTLVENLVTYHPGNQYQLYAHRAVEKYSGRFPLNAPSVSIHTPGSGVGRMNSSLWRSFLLKSDLENERPDIYHGLSHELPVGIQKLKGIKTVVTIHDLIFLRYPEYYRWAERAIYLRKFRYACRCADRVITVSEQTKRDIIDCFGTSEDKIETVYQSCDPLFLKSVEDSTRGEVLRRYDLPAEYILYVGSFNERKNLLGLVEALNLLRSSGDIPLVMIGGGGYKNRVLERIDQLGLGNRVFLRSGVPNCDLPAIYQAAQLFVYPSIYEGFGIPIIEALSSRVPVITSKDGCFPEAGGPGSLYIDPENHQELAVAMEQVLTDSELAARMIKKGVEYVTRFHGRETSAHLIRLYQDLID